MIKVAVTCTHLIRDIEGYRSRFADAGLDLFLPDIPGQELAGDALVQAMDGIIGVIAGDDQFTDEVMAQLPDLKAISKQRRIISTGGGTYESWGATRRGVDCASFV